MFSREAAGGAGEEEAAPRAGPAAQAGAREADAEAQIQHCSEFKNNVSDYHQISEDAFIEARNIK